MRLSVSNIRDMLSDDQEEIVRGYIGMYSCKVRSEEGTEKSLNPDIERFLEEDAIQFSKMKTAITYLAVDEDDGALLGYFTLAHKPLKIPADRLSRKVKDHLRRFSKLDEDSNTYIISAFLLAQFGKNYAVEDGKRITGTELMSVVMEQLKEVQNRVGGTIVYLDCEADAELTSFYESQKFRLFGERISENDGKRYLQYLNFI
ncbi:MAG: GNAT family acetyltransferase [Lachnospiraceae bacterium]|nr:GNAT family acetyltransferase [Lachnospiraceae bacterium]